MRDSGMSARMEMDFQDIWTPKEFGVERYGYINEEKVSFLGRSLLLCATYDITHSHRNMEQKKNCLITSGNGSGTRHTINMSFSIPDNYLFKWKEISTEERKVTLH
jgi:hypothetical protein